MLVLAATPDIRYQADRAGPVVASHRVSHLADVTGSRRDEP